MRLALVFGVLGMGVACGGGSHGTATVDVRSGETMIGTHNVTLRGFGNPWNAMGPDVDEDKGVNFSLYVQTTVLKLGMWVVHHQTAETRGLGAHSTIFGCEHRQAVCL